MSMQEQLVVSLAKEVDEMRAVFNQLLHLDIAKQQLDYLHRGMGTATHNAVWLDVERLAK